jgi:hypothetical protein
MVWNGLPKLIVLGVDMAKNKLVKTENEHLHASGGLVIPYEVADGITRATLIESRNSLQSEMDKWKANPQDELNPNGYWMHPEDVIDNMKYVRAMNVLIGYFGGE